MTQSLKFYHNCYCLTLLEDEKTYPLLQKRARLLNIVL
jgi:hypothetical protein